MYILKKLSFKIYMSYATINVKLPSNIILFKTFINRMQKHSQQSFKH